MSFRNVQKNATTPRHTVPIPFTPPQPWVRNPTWPALPSVTSSDDKFVGLYAVYPDSNFIALNALTDSGGYTVDWGDGSAPQNYNSNVTAYYQYTYGAAGLTNTEGPVTFTASGSTVNRTAHGYTDGMTVSFATIVTTTGITVGQIYYVVNAAPNTFQVAATLGGTALTLTNNGSGTLLSYQIATVTVTPQSGKKITKLDLNIKHNKTNLQLYSTGWLDVALSLPNLTSGATLVFAALSINVRNTNLEQASILNIGGCTSLAYLFSNCRKLRSVSISASTASVTDMSYMFAGCYSLTTVPLFNTVAVTAMNNMFQNCYSLTTVPLFSIKTSGTVNMTQMFNSCFSLTSVPLLNTVAVTNMTGMFAGCSSLTTVPLFNTVAVTNMTNMFQNCYSLTTVPLFNTAAVTSLNQTFLGCYSLTAVPPFNLTAATDLTSMFYQCSSLTTVPLFSIKTSGTVNMTQMFASCSSLTTVPLFNTVAVTDMTNMFSNCSSLTTVPLFNTAAVTSLTSMFSQCSSLTTVPLFSIKTSGSIFMNTMFDSCSSLTSVPLFNTVAVTNMNGMFNNCSSLTTVPALDQSAISSAGNMTNAYGSCTSISQNLATGVKYTFSVASEKLSKTALQTIFSNLGIGSGTQTLTITNNWGVDTAITQATVALTAQSNTFTVTSAAGLSNGMFVTATGLGLSGISVTSDVAADTLGLTNHGLPNGTKVAFTALSTTTGVSTYTIYYVVNTAANTFQIALTAGGSPINLTGTNATMTLIYPNYITNISGTTITLDTPAASTQASVTVTFRLLDAADAQLKGWAVTY